MRKTLMAILGSAALAAGGCTAGDFVGLGNMATQMEANEIQRDRNQIYAQQNQSRNDNFSRPVISPAQPITIQPVREKYPFFVCNYGKDFDGDGNVFYPGEFAGIRNDDVKRFTQDEKVTLVAYGTPSKQGSDYLVKVIDKKGNVIKEIKENNPVAEGVHWTVFEPNTLNPGNYVFSVEIDGKFYKKLEIEVTEKK